MQKFAGFEKGVVIRMNGINYSALLGNTELFGQSRTTKSEKYTSSTTSALSKEDALKEVLQNQDTVDISGQSREIPKAGYDRPKRVEAKESKFKPIDEEGIQEGVELSEAARNLLEELREKYGDMDIYAANWSTDEEQQYYATLGSKKYSVLISPEALEAMAADEEVRAQYEAALDGADENFTKMKEALGEDADQIQSYSITIDKDGKASYAVWLIKDFTERNTANAKELQESQQERIEEKRAERKKQEKERLEKLEADSIEELIQKVQERLHSESVEEVETEEKITVTEEEVEA